MRGTGPRLVPSIDLSLDRLLVEVRSRATQALSEHLFCELCQFERDANALHGGGQVAVEGHTSRYQLSNFSAPIERPPQRATRAIFLVMAMRYSDLDGMTRRLMLDELDADAACGQLYMCSRLTETGEAHWPDLLRSALEHGDDASLAADLERRGYLEPFEVRYRAGVPCRAKVPDTAAALLAEGEFNRYYCRAICRRSIDLGHGVVEVYRAKLAHVPRFRSEQLIGTLIDAQRLLDDLRAHAGRIDPGEFRGSGGPEFRLERAAADAETSVE